MWCVTFVLLLDKIVAHDFVKPNKKKAKAFL